MMKRKALIWLVMGLLPIAMQAQGEFDRWFNGGTLRVDCLREGSAQGDTVWVDRWVDRQASWHGSRLALHDRFDNGDYRVVMRDLASMQEIYSYCYSNLFREYKDTPEGRTIKKQFEETLLLPMPHNRVLIVFQKRDKEMRFVDQTRVVFDPRRDLRKIDSPHTAGTPYIINGSPADHFDIAFVMQGFGDADESFYKQCCERMCNIIFGIEPFRSHRKLFNIYFVKADVGVNYNTFGADRYAMTFDVHKLHDALGTTPADHIIICINNETYGGGAIYNFYSVSSLHKMAEMVLPHELGHGIGGLADEYVDEELSYSDLHRTEYEPLEPNITNLVHFDRKWQSLLPKGIAIPTPDIDVPRNECGPLGVYEGAGYSSKGVYRPTMHCMMRDYAPFCPVCEHRLVEVFNTHMR